MHLMKILFVYSGNGALNSSIVLNQATSLKALNIDLDYFAINEKGIWGYIKHIKLLRSFLLNNSFNIIHAHYGLCGIVALLARRKEKIIVSFMGDDLLGSNRSTGQMSLTGKLLTNLNRFLSCKFYDYSIVKSEEMFRVLEANRNVRICPNGVNLDIFLPVDKTIAMQRTKFSNDNINLIFVSDPARPEKNYALAESAVEILNDRSIRLHVIKNVIPEELKYYYSAADMLIMTSLHEGSPNVVKEAMACNCPVVSTDVGDVLAVIGKTKGCYVSSFDPTEVIEKIKLAIAYRKEYGYTYGRERILELGLDSDTVAGKVIAVYKKVLLINN